MRLEEPRLPDFFIIGAPRSGTTSLWKYLKNHQKVFLPAIKEPTYFAHDFPNTGKIKTWDEYVQLFSRAPQDACVGEASVWYLYSSLAVRRIVKRIPHAKIIVLLRNPIEAAYSLYSYKRLRFEENFESFEEAWHSYAARARGLDIPTGCPEPAHLLYKDIYSYSNQLERLLSYVSKSNTFIALYEDVIRNQEHHYKSVVAFLQLQYDEKMNFPRAARTKIYKNRSWERAVRYAVQYRRRGGTLVKFADRCMQRVLGARGRNRLIRSLTEPGWKDVERQPLDGRFRRAILTEMESEIRRVEDVLQRSLDVWRR